MPTPEEFLLRKVEGMSEPGPLPAIDSVQSNRDQFDLEAKNAEAARIQSMADEIHEQEKAKWNMDLEQRVREKQQRDQAEEMMKDISPGGRYNPFEGQFIRLQDGSVVPRTPENSVPAP